MIATNGNGHSRLLDAQGRPLLTSPTKGYKSVAAGIVFGGIGWTGIGLDFIGGGPLADLPHFTRTMIEAMKRESLCKFATGMVKSPYSSAGTLEDPQDRESGFKGFFVDCPNPAVKRTVEDALSKIWLTGSTRILEAMDYGQVGIEIELQCKRRQIGVECVKGFDPADVQALRNQRTGRIEGVRVRRVPGKARVDLVDGRGVWIVHEPIFDSHIGFPIHLGAYPPWWEKWHHRGAIFSRRLWMLNCAFRGRVVRYPMMMFGAEHGFAVAKSGRDIAIEIVDNCTNGGALAIPNLFDDKGNPLWQTEDPKAMEGGQQIVEYPKDLDTEQLRGYGIPDNIITATLQDSTGTYGGRAISFEAFLAMRQIFWVHLLSEIDRQSIRHIVRWNHGPHADYELRATELMPREKPNKQSEQPGGMPGLPMMGQPERMSYGGFLDRHLDEYIERAVGRGTIKASAVVAGQEAFHRMSAKQYASSHFALPPAITEQFVALGNEIEPDKLGTKGIEREPHITVKYGLHADDPAAIAKVVNGFGPVTVTLGTVSVFHDANEGDDVLKVDIHGDDIIRLNALISASLANTETHPVYKPHATIAYVKAGKGDKFIGDDRFDGLQITFDKIIFSSTESAKSEISLGHEVARLAFDESEHPRDKIGEFTDSDVTKQRKSVFASWTKKDKLHKLPLWRWDYGEDSYVVNIGGDGSQKKLFQAALSNALGRDVDEWREGFKITHDEASTIGIKTDKSRDGETLKAVLQRFSFDESKHPRGQPENAGEFGPGGGGSTDLPPEIAQAKNEALAGIRQGFENRAAGDTEPKTNVKLVGRHLKSGEFDRDAVHPNLIEYATRDLFKGKSVTQVSRSVAKKFNGSENPFLGGKVSVTPEQLADAIFRDKASLAIKAMSRVLPGKEEFAIAGTIQQFHFNEKDASSLREYIRKQLLGTSQAMSVSRMSAASGVARGIIPPIAPRDSQTGITRAHRT